MEYHQDEAERFHPEGKPRRTGNSHPAIGWLAALFITVILSLAGSFDYASAIDADTAEKEARAASIQFRLDYPINWSATVTQSGPGINQPRTRFYVPTKESK